ncbi:MAG: hypothetical protein UY09_C0047G0014 [Parcubacteria group bacterium GW2011_GWA2_47_8]|nr:MAG: hypothetical protein UY09_C0047G0014 [Parcubacteria group bacterium GW2011_GWA2_47_8]OHB19351.1 MAG: antitoxin [Parcubacteria group bacterium RIFCSPHIGHO2_01_FULL_47_10b]
MKYFELDKEERQIVKSFEAGKLKSIPGAKKKLALYQKYVRSSLRKDRNINIRLSEKDLQKIKTVAAQQGIPYQTLISSLLHQYSSGKVRVS